MKCCITQLLVNKVNKMYLCFKMIKNIFIEINR